MYSMTKLILVVFPSLIHWFDSFNGYLIYIENNQKSGECEPKKSWLSIISDWLESNKTNQIDEPNK